MEDFDSWLKHGRDQGLVSDVYCDIHQGRWLTEEEAELFEEGEDPCILTIRVLPRLSAEG